MKARGQGIVLRSWRIEKGLSVREVAKRVGVSATHISQIERGLRNATGDVALRIADVYHQPRAVFFEVEREVADAS